MPGRDGKDGTQGYDGEKVSLVFEIPEFKVDFSFLHECSHVLFGYHIVNNFSSG